MRVYFKRVDDRKTVIEIIQMIRYDSGELGLVMPYSQYGEKRNYNFYMSTRKVEEREVNNWCEQLLRSGYLDLTCYDINFKSNKS